MLQEQSFDIGPVAAAVPSGRVSPAVPDVDEACRELIGLQRRRVFAIKTQSRLERSVEAFIRTQLGFNTQLPEKERKVISARAQKLKASIERGDPVPEAEPFVDLVVGNGMSRKLWDDYRDKTEASMIRLAKTLPVYPWVEGVKGVSAKSLAVIVGEAGNLANYPDRSRLQKRLSIGVMGEGMRQGNPGPNATAEDWIAHGYNKRRRAEIWALLDDVMLRAQWRGAKKDEDGEVVEPGYPIGPYGAHYARKKAEYVEREHPAPDRAARRYMAKMFIRDLWVAWRSQ